MSTRRHAIVTLAVAAVALLVAPAARATTIDWSLSGTRGDAGWWVSDVYVEWTVTDYTGEPTQDCVRSVHLVADTKGVAVSCTIVTVADGSASKTTPTIRIDRTAPTPPVATPARPPDQDGWYDRPVAIAWSGTDATSGIATCTAFTYSGPDGSAAAPSGTCRDTAGNVSAAVPFGLRYDATAPQIVAAQPDRLPDHAGWYVRPVTFSLQAIDATSGVAGCAPLTYAGPDGRAAVATATCTDAAGNVATARVPLRYDATAPTFGTLVADAARTSAALRWTASADTTTVSVRRANRSARARTFHGSHGKFTDAGLRPGTRLMYTVRATDAAGHTTTRRIRASRPSLLLAPAPGARLSAPPVLRWRAQRRARYYNVQLYRGGRKVLSAWPARPRLALSARWRYGGALRRLAPGRYRWYVWPGYGSRAQRRYGALLGHRDFLVVRS